MFEHISQALIDKLAFYHTENSDPPLGSVTPSSRLATSILQLYRISKSEKKKKSSQYQEMVNGDHKALYFSFSGVSTERFETIQKRRAELGYRNLDTGDVHPDSRLKSPPGKNSWQPRQSSKEIAAGLMIAKATLTYRDQTDASASTRRG